MAACECYVAMMEMDDTLQAMNIEEHRTVMELVEKLEEVLLDDLEPRTNNQDWDSRQSRHPPRAHGFSEKQSRCICLDPR